MTDSGSPSPRVLVITGEGGLSMAEVAVATALRCAALGHRTLLTSMDDREVLDDMVHARGHGPSEAAESQRRGDIAVNQRRVDVANLLWLDGALPDAVQDVAVPL